jgi:hypothetical protein
MDQRTNNSPPGSAATSPRIHCIRLASQRPLRRRDGTGTTSKTRVTIVVEAANPEVLSEVAAMMARINCSKQSEAPPIMRYNLPEPDI